MSPGMGLPEVVVITRVWAAGALPLLQQTALCLEADALHGTMHIHRPRLPNWLRSVTFHGLRVANASVALQYRCEDSTMPVTALGRRGAVGVADQC